MSLRHRLFPLTIVLTSLLLSTHLAGSGSPRRAGQQPAAWEVKLAAAAQAKSNVQVRNSCSGSHTFKAVPQNLPYLQLPDPPTVTVPGGSVQNMPVTFNTAGMRPGRYEGTLNVACVDCRAEPGCRQETERLAVLLTVLSAEARPTPTPPAARPSPDASPLSAIMVPERGSLKGRVVDPRHNPVGGVKVSVHGRDAVLTNSRGEFVIRGLAATERLPVSFSASGFMDTTRIYKVGGTSNVTSVVVIWPRAAPVSLDATQGGKLTFPGGTISFPPRALVDGAGRPLQGQVKVSFSSLDVADRRQIRSAPGDFSARTRNNRIRQLETFGVFEVYVEDSEGRRVDLAKGRKAAVELFLPRVLRGRPPRQVGLYAFDKGSGLWAEEGTLELNSVRPSLNGLIDSVTTTSWNADVTLDTVCMKVKILNEDGTPAPIGTRVEAEGVDYTGTSPTGYVTDASGEVCLLVKKCVATVRVVAYDQNNAAVNSCPVRIGTPCTTTAASDCSDPAQCPLQPEEIILPGGTLYHDMNADDPAYWHEAHNWTNWTTINNFYDVWWYADHVVFNNDGIMRLLLDAAPPPPSPQNTTPVTYSSGEYRTNATYGYGTYEVCLKAAAGPGLMTSFFTYTGPPDTPQHHEIDVEFRGQNTWEMWTNFFYDNTDHAQAIPLGFDAAEDFHRYKFVWSQSEIKWYVDGVERHTESAAGYPDWPTVSGKIMANLWSGNSISDNWLGDFCTAQIPVTAEYDWIRYKQP